MKICTHKQFWCKEILFFLGIEDEHEQVELLLQHKNSLPKKKSMYKKLQEELIEHENRLQIGNPPKKDEYQHKENVRKLGRFSEISNLTWPIEQRFYRESHR